MDFQNNIVVYGKKGNKEYVLGYPKDVVKKDLFCYPKTLFKFYAPVPQREINSLRAPAVNNLKKTRLFATLTLEPMQSYSFTRFLNPERFLNVADYRQYFLPYLNDDGITIKPEFLEKENLNFCISISEFKRIYTPTSLENNAEKSTYAMTRNLYTPAANGSVSDFEEVRLLDQNWLKLSGKLRNFAKSGTYKRPIGKSIRFLYKEAAGLLFNYVEGFLKSLGFAMIFLDADTMSLAIKIYGRQGPGGGYYPMWDKQTKKDATGLILDGYKIEEVSSRYNETDARRSLSRIPANLRSLIDCDSSSGPSMFKIIQEGVVGPVYNRDADRAFCDAAAESVARVIAAMPAEPPPPGPPAPPAAGLSADEQAIVDNFLGLGMGFTTEQIRQTGEATGWNPVDMTAILFATLDGGGKRKTRKQKRKARKSRKQRK